MSFNSIPNEIILEIFSFLDLENLIVSVPQVCKRWEELTRTSTLFDKFHSSVKKDSSDDEDSSNSSDSEKEREEKVVNEDEIRLRMEEKEKKRQDHIKAMYSVSGGIRKYFVSKSKCKKWTRNIFQKQNNITQFGSYVNEQEENGCVRVVETSSNEYTVFLGSVNSSDVRYNTIDEYMNNEFPKSKKLKLKMDQKNMIGVSRFNSHGRFLSCCCRDGYVRLIDSQSLSLRGKYGPTKFKGKTRPDYIWDHGVCCDAQFMHEGKQIISCGIFRELTIFSTEKKTIVHNWNVENEDLNIEYHKLAVNEHSKIIAVGCTKNTVELWSTDQLKETKPINTLQIENGMYPHTCLQFIDDIHLWVATRQQDNEEYGGNFQCYDLRNLSQPVKKIGTYCGDYRGGIKSLYFDNNQRRGMAVDGYGSCYLWSDVESLGRLYLSNSGSGMNDVHFVDNVFAISYSNPGSGWMGTTAVFYDGRIDEERKRENNVSENKKVNDDSKCTIQ